MPRPHLSSLADTFLDDLGILVNHSIELGRADLRSEAVVTGRRRDDLAVRRYDRVSDQLQTLVDAFLQRYLELCPQLKSVDWFERGLQDVIQAAIEVGWGHPEHLLDAAVSRFAERVMAKCFVIHPKGIVKARPRIRRP